MILREIFLYLLLGHLIAASALVCIPSFCLSRDTDSHDFCSNTTENCTNATSGCLEGFQVQINSTGSEVDEGDDITMTCDHNIPDCNLTISWTVNGEHLQNTTTLHLEKVFTDKKGQYACSVDGPCGTCVSPPHGVTVNNNSIVLLVVCGVSALALVVIMGLAMKFKLKRDNAKHKERMRQRLEAERNAGPPPFTPRAS